MWRRCISHIGEKHDGFLCNLNHVWSLGCPILVIFKALCDPINVKMSTGLTNYCFLLGLLLHHNTPRLGSRFINLFYRWCSLFL